MNVVLLMGRLVRDPQVIFGKGETKIARYTLAVDRRNKNNEADFISCVCFGKAADFAEMYLHQGTKIAVEGRIQTGSYTNKDGGNVYTTDVIVNQHDFCESRKTQEGPQQTKVDNSTAQTQPAPSGHFDGFVNIPDGIDQELPFV